VVIGWSQGAVLAALAADATQGQPGPQDDLVAGVGLFGMPGTEPFYAPEEQKAALGALFAAGQDRYLPDATTLFGATFGLDPVTGAPTMDLATYGAFYAGSRAESLLVLGQLADARTWALVTPALQRIRVPALVAAGAQDFFVPVPQTQATYAQLGSLDKDVTILGRNGHGFFLEDNFHATMRVFDAFLARF
jgi:pimeloyl-ACP methyl ester carboxylesterase